MKKPKISAVIFDADGLMLDSERLSLGCWKIAGREFGYEIRAEDHQRVLGLTVDDSRKVFKEIFGADFPFDAIRARRLELGDALFEQEGMPVKPGLRELLDFLSERQFPRAVATSTDREFAEKKLRAAGIRHYFEVVVAGDEIRHGKPAPDIFLAAAAHLGVPPANCLVLEDSEPGIRGAHTAGMVPVMVPDLKPPSPEIQRIAYRILPSLNEVHQMLREELLPQ